MITLRRSFRALIWTLLEKASALSIGAFGTLIIAALIPIEALGTFAIFAAVYRLVCVVGDWGIPFSIINCRRLSNASLYNSWLLISIMSLVPTLCAVAALTFMISLSPWLIVPAFLLGVLLHGFNTILSAILRRNLQAKTLAIRKVIASTIGTVVGIVLVLCGYDFWALIAQWMVILLVTSIALYLHFKPNFQFRANRRFLLYLTRKNAPLAFGSILMASEREMPRFFVGLFFGNLGLGFFELASKIGEIMRKAVVQTTNRIGIPIIAGIVREQTNYSTTLIKIVVSAAAILSIFFIVTAYYSEGIVLLVLGDKWANSAAYLAGILIVGFFSAVNSLCYAILIAQSEYVNRLAIIVFGLVTGLVLYATVGNLGETEFVAALVTTKLMMATVLYALTASRLNERWFIIAAKVLPISTLTMGISIGVDILVPIEIHVILKAILAAGLAAAIYIVLLRDWIRSMYYLYREEVA